MSPIVPLLFMYSWLLLRMPADRMVHCGLMNGTNGRLFSVFNGQPVRVLTGRRAATTCGSGVESCNVARQSGVAITNLRFCDYCTAIVQ